MRKDWGPTRSLAERLIYKFGRRASIRRERPGSGPGYDPGPPLTVDYPCQLYIDSYTSNERVGTAILASDRKVYISTQGLGISPEPSDKLVVGSSILSIVDVDALEGGETPILFIAQARR
jgi:hypothetical protein